MTTTLKEVIRLTEARRVELKNEVERTTHFSGTLSQMEETERCARTTQGREMPAPAFTEKEMRRFEANAVSLRDPEMLKQHQAIAQPQTKERTPEAQTTLKRLAARSFAREEVAEIALRESTARLTSFEERRENIPLLYTSADGQEKTTTLRELEPHSWGERVGRYFTETNEQRAEYATVQQVAVERHAQLTKDRDTTQAYYQSACEIAESYLTAHGEKLPAPHYTAKELAAIETYAARQADEQLRIGYEELVRTAVLEGRVGYFDSNQSHDEQGALPEKSCLYEKSKGCTKSFIECKEASRINTTRLFQVVGLWSF